jgi:fatty acid desaturase
MEPSEFDNRLFVRAHDWAVVNQWQRAFFIVGAATVVFSTVFFMIDIMASLDNIQGVLFSVVLGIWFILTCGYSFNS